ncbi:hypothetical protein [Pelotomaculum propionicicum]|uniref:Uncharacterized protein n=1 Tax=Pelotomaculum propionicicum TaxID=258475 RepID=A0A4Y7RVX3_9FIRM|nr:hypothetical protein [Pelotomaculum propionicicum]TEB12832.1 hypothetical protein Pmgp_00808 [Pelotomaculum propionicicum]
MINLDFLCMKTAQEMIEIEDTPKEKENVVTKGLGVLLENGPYGLILYLETNAKVRIGKHYIKHLIGLCRHAQLKYLVVTAPDNTDFGQVTKWLQDLAVNIDNYLFVKRLWQQTLTYARYHAKALDVDESPAAEVNSR